MVDYPILDQPIREILISIELLIVFVFLEISTYFLYRYWVNKKSATPSTVELDWATLFSCFGVAFIFYIYGDFFDLSGNRNLFLVSAYLSIVLGGLLFIYHLELTKTINTHYKLTILVGGLVGIFIILYSFFPTILQISANLISFIGFGIVIIYFIRVIKRIWKFYKAHSMGLLLGIFLWLLGYCGNTDIAITLFGTIWIRVIGDLIILIAMVIVAFFVNTIPSLDEIGWREKIKYILLTSNSGIPIYSENFREQKPINELLIAGGIWGLEVFLKNVIADASLKVISKGSDVVLIENGKLIMGIFVVEEDLKLLRYLLKELVTKFEYYYSNILSDWKGDLNLFKPTTHLINSIFAYKKI
jgi:hypothetical protein